MRFLGSPIRAYTSQALKRLVKTGHRVYFHITILVNRSVQLVARNHECPKELNNVPCVIWSCIKMHATNEITNYTSRLMLIICVISYTLRGVNNPPICWILVVSLVHYIARIFFCSSLKLFGSIRIAYGFYSQTLAGYNKKPYWCLNRVFIFLQY